MAYAAFHIQDPDFRDRGCRPVFHDTDGSPVYEGPYHCLLYEILRRDDVAAIHQYHACRRIIHRHFELDHDNPFHIAVKHRSFQVLRVLIEIYPEDRAAAAQHLRSRGEEEGPWVETVQEYLSRNHVSLVHEACKAADREFLGWLMAQKPPLGTLSGRDYLGRMALLSAAIGLGDANREGLWEDVMELDPDQEKAWEQQEQARRGRHEVFIRSLLEQEGCCSVQESDWMLPTIDGTWAPDTQEAEMTLMSTVLGAAIPRASYDMTMQLIAQGASPYASQSWGTHVSSLKYEMGYTTDVTPLHIASLYWNADAIRALMDCCRADDSQSPAEMVARADSRGRLPLHWALTRDRGVSRRMLLDTVALLLEANPETVNVPNHRGASAVSQAIETHANSGGSLVPLLKLLLAHGVDARVCDSKGRNILHQLARASWQPSSLDPDLLNRLLEQVGVNEPAAADGSTALHYLVRHLNQIDAARHLIQCGANANAINHQGNTPLHEVMRGVVRPRVDSTTGQLEPMPSEHLAQSLDAFIQVLVEAGASMDQLNAAGKTPTQVRDEVTESREMIRREREVQQLRMRGRGRGRGRG